MTLEPQQVMEVAFDGVYLVAIYSIVALMSRRLVTKPDPERVLHLFRNAFLLLAIGDTGHVGLRALAMLRGGLGSKIDVFGRSVSLIGVGSFATATTITLFYMALLAAWRVHFKISRVGLYRGLMVLGVGRLLLLLPNQNQWSAPSPPADWSAIRNLPLLILGCSVAVLFITHGRRHHDRVFVELGALILFSYAFFTPVVLFAGRSPAVGLLMVPKTIVYVVMASLAYLRLFARGAPGEPTQRLRATHS